MTKYITALVLVVVMATTIAIIDVRSNDLAPFGDLAKETSSTTQSIYATGVIEGASQDLQLRPENAGRITEVLVTAGQWVEQGDPLVRQDGALQRQQVALAAAKAQLARAELERLRNGARTEEREEARALARAAHARLIQAERTWLRIEQLLSEKAISQQEADDQLAIVNALRAEVEAANARVRQLDAPARADEVRAAEARVAAAEAELNMAEINAEKTVLKAPMRGRVLDVNVEVGEMSGPSAARPLIVLSDTSKIRVRAYVEELDAPRVAIGMPAKITADGLPDTVLAGRVVSISPRMSTKEVHTERSGELYDTKVREVLVEVDDATPMIIGLRVDISLDAVENANASADG